MSLLSLLSLLTTVSSKNGNETKSDIFSWDIFKSDIIFHQSQNTKMFLYLAALKLLQKQAQTSKET